MEKLLKHSPMVKVTVTLVEKKYQVQILLTNILSQQKENKSSAIKPDKADNYFLSKCRANMQYIRICVCIDHMGHNTENTHLQITKAKSRDSIKGWLILPIILTNMVCIPWSKDVGSAYSRLAELRALIHPL